MAYQFNLNDLLALGWFLLVWISYSWLSRRRYSSSGAITMNKLSRGYRKTWMHNMLMRENRVVDSALLATLIRSVSFFASGTIILVAGLSTALGAAQTIARMTAQLPFAAQTNTLTVQIKILLLISLFVYIFFKLVWSLRQYNFAVVMMGAAGIEYEDKNELNSYANKMGIVVDRGGIHFNEGMRGYEFGLAYLGWFLHPMVFAAATTLVLGVIYRREFHSNALRAMQDWEQNR